MKRKSRAALLAGIYAAALVAVLAGALIHEAAESRRRGYIIDAVYSRALSGLVTSVGELDTSLRKATYSTSPSMLCAACTDVFGKAMAAQTALGELPFSDTELTNTAGFIARVGDWAWVLAKNAAAGIPMTDGERDDLRSMSAAAQSLAGALSGLASGMDGAAAAEAVTAPEFGDGFQLIERDFPEVPSLVYDGPFSAHIARREPMALRGLPEVDAETAAHIAADFLGVSGVESAGECGGELPCYIFTADSRTVSVTKRGGAVLSMLSSERAFGGAHRAGAEQIAAQFLESRGYTGMRKSYSVTDGVTLVSFAYEENGVVCYPDLVKVGVASDGTVVSFEANGYIMNHRDRGLPEPSVSSDDARALIPGGLRILREGLAVIPTEGKNEAYCREFVCEDSEGRHVLIYVGADSGRQEKILLLLEDENGTLAL